MKLLRIGPPGQERPALLDAQGQPRDLSGRVAGSAVANAVSERGWPLKRGGHLGISGLGEQRQTTVAAV